MPARLHCLLLAAAIIAAFLLTSAIHAATVAPATAPTPATQKLILGTPFSDNMVIPRDHDVTIWGQAAPGTQLQIKLDNQTASAVTDAAGHWQATFKPLPVGGPYSATVTTGEQSITLQNIASGDVWLCSGQSNMVLGVAQDAEAAQMRAIAKTLPNLRLLTIPKVGGKTPAYLVTAQWRRADQTDIDQFTAVGFHLGVALATAPNLKNVPIGLIDSSVGGTAAEAWVPADALKDLKPGDYSFSLFGVAPSALYNQMIAPLGHLALMGVVWYQGESNAGQPQAYPQIMTSLISARGAQFDNPRLPFIIVQLPPFKNFGPGLPFTWLRDAQAKIVQAVPDTGLVVTIDTTDGFNLHPHEKGPVGRRAALQALRLAYHQDVVADGPTLVSATPQGAAMRVTFDTHGGALVTHSGDAAVHGFELAGDDGVFHFADATLEAPDTVIVQTPDVAAPKFVRYAWGSVPAVNLFNAAGLPAAPFRTDTFTPQRAIEVQSTAPAWHMSAPLYDADIDSGGNLVSLGIAKEQFVSNNLDGPGTGNFPWGWGNRGLQNVTQITPDTIRFNDGEVSATYTFSDDALTLKIRNNAEGLWATAGYHLRLAGGVKVMSKGNGYELRRGDAVVQVSGVDKVTKDLKSGASLDLTIKGKSSATVEFRFKKAK